MILDGILFTKRLKVPTIQFGYVELEATAKITSTNDKDDIRQMREFAAEQVNILLKSEKDKLDKEEITYFMSKQFADGKIKT